MIKQIDVIVIGQSAFTFCLLVMAKLICSLSLDTRKAVSLLFIYLFIYFWLCWVFVSVRGLSLVAASGGHSSSRCAGLSLSRSLLLRSTGSRCVGSVVVAHRPSCSAACGIFPDQGSNPFTPALAGRFSTTVPPGKPPAVSLLHW